MTSHQGCNKATLPEKTAVLVEEVPASPTTSCSLKGTSRRECGMMPCSTTFTSPLFPGKPACLGLQAVAISSRRVSQPRGVIRNPQHRGSQSPFWSLSLPIVPFSESSCAYCMSPCFKKPDLEHNGWGLLLGKCFFLYIKTQEEALLLQQQYPDTLTEGSFILNKANLTLKT